MCGKTLSSVQGFANHVDKCEPKDEIEEYFDLLEETIDRNGLRDKPEQIFNCDCNCDESGFPLY